MGSTTTMPERPPAPAPPRAKSSFQPEVQGLRALAVLLVVVYHFWPGRLSGGFVGVDIFFVISGYLITAHIFRDIVRTGKLALGQFWARRIRRLLPLSLLVLVATAAAAAVVLPATQWETTFRQVTASAFYVQNWVLAGDAVDYSAMDDAATAVQHFWSLSVEEQFYVFWPLLLVGVLWAVSRRGRPDAGKLRRVMVAVLAVVGAASLAFSVWFTGYDAAQAYFVTPTRVWEFVAGALAALVLQGRQFTGLAGNLLGWAGLGAVLVSAVLYTSATPFPGYTALLPVLGTVLLLTCGGREPGTGIHWWMSLRPATWVGDVSYAVYLWHWPLLVLAPFAFDSADTTPGKLVLVVLVFALAAASKVAVEDPLRGAVFLKPVGRSVGFAAAGMAVVAALAAVLPTAVGTAGSGPVADPKSACYGYEQLADRDNCAGPIAGEGAPNPSVAKIAGQAKNPMFPDCQAEETRDGVQVCELGVPSGQSSGAMAVMGDSHATAWLPALERIAKGHDLTLKVMTRSGCAPSVAEQDDAGKESRDILNDERCTQANREAVDLIASDPSVKTVFVAGNQSDAEYRSSPDFPSEDPRIDGFAEPWKQWLEAGKQVVAMEELPRLRVGNGPDVPTCIAENPGDPEECSQPVEDVYPWARSISDAAKTIDDPNFHFVRTKDYICGGDECYAQIGGIVTYYDKSHISQTYSANLAPAIERQLLSAGVFEQGPAQTAKAGGVQRDQ